MSFVQKYLIKEVSYRESCFEVFPDNLELVRCSTENCTGCRFNRDGQQRRCFIFADIKNQLKDLLQSPETDILFRKYAVPFNTRLPYIIIFKALLSYLEPKAKRLTYWEGCDTTRRSHFTKRPSRELNIENARFAVLVRLKLGLFKCQLNYDS
ncbi:Hypothetical predicted protein [Mytilus galloprovincialis]|uniref:Uncharacterized protein n=1 Tax=Mytilus galloprovincialis TaxID=29158 RepID=A0A8B6HI08_MYTGA|nr:Hypothetical predicted protein [Mytilus galloprovincialis]